MKNVAIALILLAVIAISCQSVTPAPVVPTYVYKPPVYTPPTQAPTAPEPTMVPITERPGHVVMDYHAGYADYIYRAFLQLPINVAWHDGYLYLADMTGHHIVRMAKDGTMDDLPFWKTFPGLNTYGPRGLAFDSKGNLYISNGGYLFRLDTKGSIVELPGMIVKANSAGAGDIAINSKDEIFYTDRGEGSVKMYISANNFKTIATGIKNAEHMAFGLDGTLYVSEMEQNKVVKVNVETGAVSDFFSADLGDDPIFLAVDPQGNIWVRGSFYLYLVSPSGHQLSYTIDGKTYSGGEIDWGTGGGVAIDDEGALWISSFYSRVNRLVPATSTPSEYSFTRQIPYLGFRACSLAVGPQGEVYAVDELGMNILRFDSSGETVLKHYDVEGKTFVAVNRSGQIYLGMADRTIVILNADGTTSHHANIRTHSMVFGGDGALYAVSGDTGEIKTIVRITGVDAVSTFIDQLSGQPLGSGSVYIAPALDKGLYVLVGNNNELYFVDFSGQAKEISDLSYLKGGYHPKVLTSSPTSGNVYYLSHFDRTVFQIEPNGVSTQIASHAEGDPWAMAVSNDGQWLYIGENGAIDKVPLSITSSNPTPAAPTGSLIFRDDFNGVLQSGWTWQNEVPAKHSFAAGGWLQITGEGGGLFNGQMQSNVLWRDLPFGDFAITVHLKADPSADFQQAALMLKSDSGDYVLLGRGYCDTSHCQSIGSGVFMDYKVLDQTGNFAAGFLGSEVYLKLEMKNYKLTAYYGSSPDQWTELGSFPNFVQFTQMGLGSANLGADGTGGAALTANFDYFEITKP